MKESISNSMIFSIVITVIAVSAGIVFFSLGYSKTYKIKNKIINIIEQNGGYNDTNKDKVKEEIDEYLRKSGYSSYVESLNEKCPNLDKTNIAINELDNYKYCIYEHETIKGNYYTVKVFMTYNLPLVGDFYKLKYSLRGDTMVIVDF